MLVDTGTGTGTVAGSAEFIDALASVIDPSALRWIWLTHTDFDHIGSLAPLLETNPDVRVITSFLGTGILFSSDCFGALLPAVSESAADLDSDTLRGGQVRWATIDSPWIHEVDRDGFDRTLGDLRKLEPTMVCSSHLPPAPGAMLDLFLDSLAMAPDADRFVGPDQVDLESMMAAMGAQQA